MSEEIILGGAEGNLVGVFTAADDGGEKKSVGVVFLNAGLIHRPGPGRLYVQLARRFAARGIPGLRLDFSGIGDSPGRQAQIPLMELAAQEPLEGADMLQRRGVDKVVLLGVCSGAYAAFEAIKRDERVVGAVLVNPQELAITAGGEAESWARRYFTNSIFRPKAWLNLLTGRINYKRLFSTLRRRASQKLTAKAGEGANGLADVKASLDIVTRRGGRVLFVLSDMDVSVEHVGLILGADLRKTVFDGDIAVHLVPGADHLFTRPSDKNAVASLISNWVERISST